MEELITVLLSPHPSCHPELVSGSNQGSMNTRGLAPLIPHYTPQILKQVQDDRLGVQVDKGKDGGKVRDDEGAHNRHLVPCNDDEVHSRHGKGVSPWQSSAIGRMGRSVAAGRRGDIKAGSQGFSLIELLVSIIIISLIISAFTPILSSKLKHREIAYSTVKQMTIDCTPFDTSDGTCLLCTEAQCNLCTSSINVADGYYVNPNLSCDRKSCGDFDTNCRRCTKDGCQECRSGYNLNSSKRCILATCNKGFYLSGSSCKNCGAGTFQANDNSTATNCTNCSTKTPNCTNCGVMDGICSACESGFNLTGATCNAIFDTKTFYYTGGVQTWTAPYSGTFKLEVWGAQGGAQRASGGYGGYAQGRKTLSAGQVVYIYVGGMGGAPAGGFNGGGNGGSAEGGGGGGATDIRIGGTDYANRVIVAGGGGGGGYGFYDRYSTGGTGGGTTGGMGTNSCSHCGTGGQGAQATQSGGAALGKGANSPNSWDGGGGGGGYFGGTHGGNYNGGSGGGGGSGFIGGVSSGSTSNGVRSGHGVAIITKI